MLAATKGFWPPRRLIAKLPPKRPLVQANRVGLTAASTDPSIAFSEALVRRAQNGDAEAFSDLIEDQYDRIFRTAWRWCGNAHDAEDIAQDVCVRLGTAIRGFDGRSAFSSWVYRITLNMVRDWQRAGRRRGANTDAYAEIHLTEEAPAQEDAATNRELWSAV